MQPSPIFQEMRHSYLHQFLKTAQLFSQEQPCLGVHNLVKLGVSLLLEQICKWLQRGDIS